MKRSKSELFFDAWCRLLDYLDRHKIQGRIAVVFFGLIGLVLTIKYTSPEIVLIIEAIKQ